VKSLLTRFHQPSTADSYIVGCDTRLVQPIISGPVAGRRLSKIMNTDVIYNARTPRALPARIYLDCARRNELTTTAPRPMMFYKIFRTIHHSMDVITRLARFSEPGATPAAAVWIAALAYPFFQHIRNPASVDENSNGSFTMQLPSKISHSFSICVNYIFRQ